MVLRVLPCLSSPFAYADHSTSPALVSPAAARGSLATCLATALLQPELQARQSVLFKIHSLLQESESVGKPKSAQRDRVPTHMGQTRISLQREISPKLRKLSNSSVLNGTLPTGTREGKRAQTGTADLRASKDGAPRTKRCRLCRPTHG